MDDARKQRIIDKACRSVEKFVNPDRTISIRHVKLAGCRYQVQVFVDGFIQEEQAIAAKNYLERLLCGPEISTNG